MTGDESVASEHAYAGDSLLVLRDADIRRAVDAGGAVQSQRDAFTAVFDGTVRLSGSTSGVDRAVDGLVFALTGAIQGRTGIACKFGFQAPLNTPRGLPPVHALVTLLDPDTGVPLACLNGTTITTMRTAAGLVAAAEALAAPGAHRLAILGSGVQARECAYLAASVRPLSTIQVYSPTERRNALAADLRAGIVGPEVVAAHDAGDAVRSADLVFCCTSSREPVVRGSWLAPGTTLLTMGSYQPDRREIDLESTSRSAAVFVDEREKASQTCGPLQEAFAAGVLAQEDIAEIGGVLAGKVQGRREDDDILIFHSVGLGVQDAALGWHAYLMALESGLGSRVPDF